MKRKILAAMAFLLAANTMTAQINTDDILDSLINDVQQGKEVENVEISLDQSTSVKHRLLVIGDDQLQGIGPRLYNYALATGYTIFTSIWMESTTKKWAFSSDLRQLIKKVQPTFIIVCLGTHDLAGGDIPTRTQAVKTIMDDIGDIPFVWMGPVEVKTISEDPGVVPMLRKTVGEDRFYDSYNLRLAREDEMHPTAEACQKWVDGFIAWLGSTETAHPIHFDTPKALLPFKNVETHKASYQGKKR